MNNISENKIKIIGRRLVNCKLFCEGVNKNISKGILPRCLFYEKNSHNKNGCAIVGLNPGVSKLKEIKYYLKNECTYESTVEYWKHFNFNHFYYKRLRNFVRSIDILGPILWTELVKCESTIKNVKLPLQTFRICVEKHLRYELESFPINWPIVAVGKEAFIAISYLYPRHIVIGVPHPTSSRGHFACLFHNNNLKSEQYNNIKNVLENNISFALWLSS